MSCAKQPWIISKYLNDQLNRSKVSLQYMETGLSASARNPHGHFITWNFVKNNWEYLIPKLFS